jgi:AcrR family transcriptional regulator
LPIRKNLKKDKKDRIVEAAARTFAQKGYAGASVADIAFKAGIGKGTVYEYFNSKEDLFFAVFEWFIWKTDAAAKVGISVLGGSASERLKAMSESIMSMWDAIEDVFTLTMEFWAASASSQIRDRIKNAFRLLYAEFRKTVVGLVQDGIDRGEFRTDINPEPIAAALVGTWDALFLQAWFDDTFDPAATADEFLEVLIRGLST